MFNDTVNFLLTITFVMLTVVGCSYEHMTSGGEIEAIYWHEHERYTAVTINADIVTQHRIPPYHGVFRTITLYTDVAPGEKSWYKCEWDFRPLDGADTDTAYCDIHIHNLDELGTADWNHGKFGSGATIRID